MNCASNYRTTDSFHKKLGNCLCLGCGHAFCSEHINDHSCGKEKFPWRFGEWLMRWLVVGRKLDRWFE